MTPREKSFLEKKTTCHPMPAVAWEIDCKQPPLNGCSNSGDFFQGALVLHSVMFFHFIILFFLS